MKRSALERRTPLKRKKPLAQRAKKPKKSRDYPGDFSHTTRRRIRERSGGRCEARIVGVCSGRARHAHHRKSRRFGDHSLVNGLDVCFDCHDWIHRHPALSRLFGLMVRSYSDPASITVIAGLDPGREQWL